MATDFYGNTIAVGSPVDDINLDIDQGGVYVFTNNGSELPKLFSSDSSTGDKFGVSVSMSDDGSRIVVGAIGDDGGIGASYIFDNFGTLLSEMSGYGISGDEFGTSVAISGNKNYIAVGSPNNDTYGAVYIFDGNGLFLQKLVASDFSVSQYFGYRIAINNSGDKLAVGAYGDNGETGAVYIFTRTLTTFSETLKITGTNSGDQFGSSLSMNEFYIIVGSSGCESAYIYNYSGTMIQKLNDTNVVIGDMFGICVDISDRGDIVIVSSFGANSNKGYVSVFYSDDLKKYTKISTLEDTVNGVSGDYFGESICISGDGFYIFVGSPVHFSDRGEVNIFKRT